MKFYICFLNTSNIAKIYIFTLYLAYFIQWKKLLGVSTENLTIKYCKKNAIRNNEVELCKKNRL